MIWNALAQRCSLVWRAFRCLGLSQRDSKPAGFPKLVPFGQCVRFLIWTHANLMQRSWASQLLAKFFGAKTWKLQLSVTPVVSCNWRSSCHMLSWNFGSVTGSWFFHRRSRDAKEAQQRKETAEELGLQGVHDRFIGKPQCPRGTCKAGPLRKPTKRGDKLENGHS